MNPADLVARLRAAGCVHAEEEAAILFERTRDEDELALLAERRAGGEPLEHVVGWAEFCGIRVQVDPGVFVPRRRTEDLIEVAAAHHPHPELVVDLCCGSGALGLALVRRLDVAPELHAADISPEAVACARRNLAGTGTVHAGDLFAALPTDLRGRVDVLVANTPYVPDDQVPLLPAEARLYEPLVALSGGPDGLDLARRVLDEARSWLAPGGAVHIEVSREQAPVLAGQAAALGLAPRVQRDVFTALRQVGRAMPGPDRHTSGPRATRPTGAG